MLGFIYIFMAANMPLSEPVLYTLENSVTLESSDTGWDYIKMQEGTPLVFIARDEDGLTVFDVDQQKVVGTVEQSKGANGPLLIPQHNRGYSAMTDGSILAFSLDDLSVIDRMPLSQDVGLNSAIYDPFTQQVHAITGTGERSSTWFTLDAATGKLLRTINFPFRKMDDPASDESGHLFAPVRYDSLILKLEAKTLAEEARWTTPCNVSKVRFISKTNRILGACYGENPQFFALNASTGDVVAKLPIGMGMDALIFDEDREMIITSNGADASLTVIKQINQNNYRSVGTVSTRPNARMMTLDKRSGKLIIVAADSTHFTAKNGEESRKKYHPNSFTVMTYQPDFAD